MSLAPAMAQIRRLDCSGTAMLLAAGMAIGSPQRHEPIVHRTLFSRDPDGNILAIDAEI